MPISRRSVRRSSFGSSTRWPHTSIEPSWIVSSRLMQRSAVLLPEPDWPISATTSPALISKETPFSTSSAPKRLTTLVSLTATDIELPLERAAPDRQRVADSEIEKRCDTEDQEGLEQGVVDDLRR